MERGSLLVALAVSAAFVLSAAPLTQLSMHSEAGDYIGAGRDYFYDTSDGAFSIQTLADYTGDGRPDYITIRFWGKGFPNDWWYLDFGTNRLGTNLEPGFYPDAQRAPFATAGHPGLDIWGNGRGCNQVVGSFTILRADLLLPEPSFAATFEQHCEGAAPALSGTIYFSYDPSPTVPEPGTMVLAVLGLVPVLFLRRTP